MPRCYFHIHDGRSYPDRVGIELPNMEAVQDQAVRVLSDFSIRNRAKFWEDRELRLDVTDANGLILLNLVFLVGGRYTPINVSLLTGALSPP